MNYHKLGFIALLKIIIITNAYTKQNTDTTSFPRFEKFPVFNINYQYSSGGYRGFAAIDGSLKYPYAIKPDLYLITGANYFLNRCNINDDLYINNTNLHSISLSIGVIKPVTNRLNILCLISPTIASTLNSSVSNNDIFLQTDLITTYRISESTEVGVGLSYYRKMYNTNKQVIYPLTTVKYNRNNIYISATLPSDISIKIRKKKRDMGIYAKYTDKFYHSNSPLLTTDTDLLNFSQITVGPTYTYKDWKDMHIKIYLGFVVHSKLKAFNRFNNKISEHKPSGSLIFNIALHILK